MQSNESLLRNYSERYKQLLEQSGLKPTHQRIVILGYLMSCNEHPGAEDIFEALRSAYPTISLGTIYRTLEIFSDAKLIYKVHNKDGKLLFDGRNTIHHHFYDTDERKIIDFESPELDLIIKKYLSENPIEGYEINSFQLHVEGKKEKRDC